jgi:hypothetical protein
MEDTEKVIFVKTYRIDNRTVNIGDTLLPQNQYQSKLEDVKKSIEEILEEHRPKEKPARHSILMLFPDFIAARNHWVKQKEAKFYRTKVSESNILHKGDYMLVEQIYGAIMKKEEDKAKDLALSYWEGKMSANPIVELFVKEAVVEKLISDSEEQRKHELKIKHSAALGGFTPDKKIPRVTDDE